MNQVINVLKRHPNLYRFLRFGIYARLKSVSREKIFRSAYEKNLWNDTASASGPGSNLLATENIRRALPDLMSRLDVKRLLDIPCGDFHWMREVNLESVAYVGADLVEPLIQKNRDMYGSRGDFIVADLLTDPLPAVDMIFCRDCLVHLSFREIGLAIRNVAKTNAKFVALTTFPAHSKNEDTVTPYWRALNFQLEPFNLPEPLEMVRDFSDSQVNDQGKYLGVWRLSDLREAILLLGS